MYSEAKMVSPMLVWKLPDPSQLSTACAGGEYFGQLKIDGYFYQYEKTENNAYLFSRNVSTTTGLLSEKGANVPHIMNALAALPPRTTLIGEIFVPGGTSKNVTSIMGCLPAKAIERQKDAPIHYYIHDIIEYDGVNLMSAGAEDRYKILCAIWEKHGLSAYNFLSLAISFYDNIEEHIQEILANGGEGAVLKKKTAPYTPGKRPAWDTIKVKQMDGADLVCMGFCDATKEYTGKDVNTWEYWDGDIPVTKGYYYGWKTAIRVGAYDGDNLVEIGTVASGLTDALREDFAKNPKNYLGKTVELSCMSIDKKAKTLRHPHFIRFRDDKSPTECTIKEIF